MVPHPGHLAEHEDAVASRLELGEDAVEKLKLARASDEVLSHEEGGGRRGCWQTALTCMIQYRDIAQDKNHVCNDILQL